MWVALVDKVDWRQDMKEQLSKMKAAIEARVKAEPGNAGAWRELAQVKMMLGDIDGACIAEA